jgi:GNAT superfamily N-acetyltransferase
MSIKAVIRNHFTNNPIREHWDYIIHDNREYYQLEQFIKDNELNVRPFDKTDLEECAELFKRVFSADPWYDNWISRDQVRNYLNELIKNPVFEGFVAFEGSLLVAVCLGHRRSFWMGKEFFIDEFFVENEKQGNGIGTRTLDIITENLYQIGYTRLTLLTNKGIPAESFYLKNGFYNNFKRTVMVRELQ